MKSGMRSSVMNATSLSAMNHSDVGGELKRLEHGEIWTPEVTQRVATIVALMALTLVGNVAIIVRLATCRRCCRGRRQGQGRTTATTSNPPSRVNVFIVNLAVGDLTVCGFTMTTEVLFVVFEKAWLLGAAACRLLLYVQVCSVTVRCTVTRPTQPPILSGMGNEYQSTCGEGLRWGSKAGMAHSTCVMSVGCR